MGIAIASTSCAGTPNGESSSGGASSGASGASGAGSGGTSTAGTSGAGTSGASGAGSGGASGASGAGSGGTSTAGTSGAGTSGATSGGAGTGGASGGASGASSGGTGGQTTTGGTAGVGGQSGMGGAGNSGGAGDAGAAGAGGSAGAAGGSGLPLGNPPVPSAGCGEAPMMTTGSKMITSSGDQRHYNITIPTNYDIDKPYRVIYASHGLGGDGNDITRENYYGLKSVTDDANDPAVFIAPSGLGGAWGEKDHPLFDDILALVKQNLCVDTSRVFVLGFSFGGMYSYSLSLNHQSDIRAAIGLGPANYNIWLPPKTHEPIAWMQTTGMSDGTTPWVSGNSTTRGAKYIAIEHATDNGCMVPAEIPTWESGGTLCYDFVGCDPGYPVKVCTFNGGHSLPSGISDLMWDFITQF